MEHYSLCREKGEIKICNDGRGIPVRKWAQDESIYIPTLIFGKLLTSDNFNDDQKRITGMSTRTLICLIHPPSFQVAEMVMVQK